MITPAYVRTMAAYNRWQNQSLYGAADELSDAERKQQRGAFFGSIHGTLSHLLWGDQIWMSRFAGTPRPKARHPRIGGHGRALGGPQARARGVRRGHHRLGREARPAMAGGDLTWFSGAAKRDVTKPKALLVAHFFNHQTHHRGQVHCMLTQCGAKPGATDLSFCLEGADRASQSSGRRPVCLAMRDSMRG